MKFDFLTKEFVCSYSFNNATSYRDYVRTLTIDGRQYDKHCTDTISYIVGNLYKVEDEKYLLLVGMSRQAPEDLNPNFDAHIESASEKSFSSPTIMVFLDHKPDYDEFYGLTDWYVSNQAQIEVKTQEELETRNSNK